MIKRADTAGLGACRLSCGGEVIRRCQFWALHSNTWIISVKSLWQSRISGPVRKQPLEKLSKIKMKVKSKWGAERCWPFRFNSNLFSFQQITHSTATSFPPLIFPPESALCFLPVLEGVLCKFPNNIQRVWHLPQLGDLWNYLQWGELIFVVLILWRKFC